MKKHLVLLIALILTFAVSARTQTVPNEHDTQVWNEMSVTFPIYKIMGKDGKETEKLSGFFSGNLRIGQNSSHFVDERIGFGIDYKIAKSITIGTSYLYRAGQPTKDKKEFEHRLRFDVSLEKKWKHFSLKDRNRIEQRIRHSKDDTTRYRNKLQLKVPVKYGDGNELFTPFVADEIYYDFRQATWFRNEFSVGISKKLANSTTAEFFYMIQSNNNVSVLKRMDIVGINLKFKID